MKIAICKPEGKFSRVPLLGSSSILILLIFTPYIAVSFGELQIQQPSVKNVGADSFSEFSRESNTISTDKSYSADANDILAVQFDQVWPQQQQFVPPPPQQQFVPPPPDTNVGADSFSEFSRDFDEEED